MNKKLLYFIIGLVVIAIIGIIVGVVVLQSKTITITLIDPISSVNPPTVKVRRGTRLKSIEAPKREGYHLKGYYYNGEILDSEYVLKGDMELQIIYESDDIETAPKMYIVTFENS